MPKPQQIAELGVNGLVFRDWTSVQVRRHYTEAADAFEFSVSETGTVRPGNKVWRVRTGDAATVKLAGVLAATGNIHVRQAAYDAERHGVLLQGLSKVGDLVQSSVDLKGGQVDGYPIEAIAAALLRPYGISFRIAGADPSALAPFSNFAVQPGETVFTALERLCRMRGLFLMSQPDGNLLAAQHDPSATTIASLVEGGNIVSARAVIRDDSVFSKIEGLSQIRGTDDRFGDRARDIGAIAENPSVGRYRYKKVLAEEPLGQQALQCRVDFEMAIAGTEQIDVEIVVHGWLRAPGELWEVGKNVHVKSPMLLLDMPLAIRGVVFSQDAQGTMTNLELCRPQYLSARPYQQVGRTSDQYTGSPQPARPAGSDNGRRS